MTSPRHDLYAFIHKGLRAFMAHALVRVGRLDPHDPAEAAEVVDEVGALLDICGAHVAHEDAIVHPALQARAPGSAAAIEHDHEGHRETIATLRALLARVPGSDAAARTLYHALGQFVAHNFEHMEREETEHNAVLWAHYSDEELRAIEHRIHLAVKPEHMQLALRWMLPQMNPGERAAMLKGMRQDAPPEAFAGVLGLVRPLLGGRDWRKLSLALGL
jgi:hypothetical protein